MALYDNDSHYHKGGVGKVLSFSQCCSLIKQRTITVVRVGFAIAQAGSAFSGVVGSLGKSVWGIGVSSVMTLITGFNGYSFQGREYAKRVKPKPEILSPDYGAISDDAEDHSSGCGNSKSSTAAQILYAFSDAANSGFNRYFILSTILKSLTSSAPLFWGYFGVSMVIKQIFNMTNETYAATKEIAEHCQGKEADSCFKQFFCCVGNTSKASAFSASMIRKLGSFDHAINDDLLPLIALVPSVLLTNPIFLGVASPFALPLAYAIYKQTELFEVAESERNLRGEQNLTIHPNLNGWRKSVIRGVIKYLMALLHGFADGVPVHLVLREWNLGLSITAGVLTALTSAFVINNTEVPAALEQLDPDLGTRGEKRESQLSVIVSAPNP